jgi:hypothetical protein
MDNEDYPRAEMTENSSHPIDLEFERENLISSPSILTEEVFLRGANGDFIDASRDEDSLAMKMQSTITKANVDDVLPPVRVVKKKRPPPRTLPPIKLTPKTNSDNI